MLVYIDLARIPSVIEQFVKNNRPSDEGGGLYTSLQLNVFQYKDRSVSLGNGMSRSAPRPVRNQ